MYQVSCFFLGDLQMKKDKKSKLESLINYQVRKILLLFPYKLKFILQNLLQKFNLYIFFCKITKFLLLKMSYLDLSSWIWFLFRIKLLINYWKIFIKFMMMTLVNLSHPKDKVLSKHFFRFFACIWMKQPFLKVI